MGLRLAKGIAGDPGLARRLDAALQKAAPEDAAAERQVLEAALRAPARPSDRREIAPGLYLEAKTGRAVLSGKAVNPAFLAALEVWVRAQNP